MVTLYFKENSKAVRTDSQIKAEFEKLFVILAGIGRLRLSPRWIVNLHGWEAFTFVENEKLIVWKSRILPWQRGAVPDAVSMMDQSAAHIRTGDVQGDDRGCREKGARLEGAQIRQILSVGALLGARKAKYGTTIL